MTHIKKIIVHVETGLRPPTCLVCGKTLDRSDWKVLHSESFHSGWVKCDSPEADVIRVHES